MQPYQLQLELLNASRESVRVSEEALQAQNGNLTYESMHASHELAACVERNRRDLKHRESALGPDFLAYEKATKDRLEQLRMATKRLTDETRHAEYLRVVVEAGPSAFATIEKALKEQNISLGEIMAKIHAAGVNSANSPPDDED